MFVHMSIHYVKPEYESNLIESMKRFGNAMRTFPGFRNAYVLKDSETGNLIGMAIWESRENMISASPAMTEAVSNDDFATWEDREPQSLHLEEVYKVNP